MKRLLCGSFGHTIPARTYGPCSNYVRYIRVIYGWGIPVVYVDHGFVNFGRIGTDRSSYLLPKCMCGVDYVKQPRYVQKRIKAAADALMDVE